MTELAGKRVLVVEDELIIALDIEDILSQAGCVVIGPFNRVSKALAEVGVGRIDVALLDINVADKKILRVAFALEDRNIPFHFLSGNSRIALPRDRPDWEACSKPFGAGKLIEHLGRMVNVKFKTS